MRERIARAARMAGRDPAQIRLIAVTKGVPAERIREAIACGVTEIGENRVQEAQAKQASSLGTGYQEHWVPGTKLRWHLIGHLQRNKATLAARMFDCIHSVDSLELVEALGKSFILRQAQDERVEQAQGEQLAQGERMLEVLVQVNVSGEATQHGCRPEEAEQLAEVILKTKHLKLAGLMTLAPFFEDKEMVRPVFRQLRELRDGLQKRFSNSSPFTLHSSLHLSMGMSHDFEVAVQEGATMVRIGTAIFGERGFPLPRE